MNPQNRLVADRWSKALALPSIESFQLAGPIPPPFMPDFSLLDWYYWRKGMAFSAKYLRGREGPMFKRDVASLGLAFPIPVILIEGDADYNTPSEPAEQLFTRSRRRIRNSCGSTAGVTLFRSIVLTNSWRTWLPT